MVNDTNSTCNVYGGIILRTEALIFQVLDLTTYQYNENIIQELLNDLLSRGTRQQMRTKY